MVAKIAKHRKTTSTKSKKAEKGKQRVQGLKISKSRNTIVALIAVLAIGAIGSLLLFQTRAATPVVNKETESGTAGGSAIALADTTASGGHAVKFGTGAVLKLNDAITGTAVNQFNFDANWAADTTGAPSAYNADNHYANASGATYSVQFSGTQAKVYTEKNSVIGISGVSIDGGTETMVDSYAATRQDQALVYTSPVLASGAHTLRVRNTGTKNAAASDTYLVADRVDIIGDTTGGAGTGGGGTGGGTGGTTPVPTGVGGTWKLKFDDEFDGTALDTAKWTNMANTNMSSMNGVTTAAGNISVSGGFVNLLLSSNTVGAYMCTCGTGQYQLPVGGYTEARVYFPGTASTFYNWPAWWTTSLNLATNHWPTGGEHDIAEAIGDGNAIAGMRITYHSNSGAHSQGNPPGTWVNGYHVYGLWRQPGKASVYWDGQLVASYNTDDDGWLHSLILNVGNGQWGGPAVTGAAGAMHADYVRAWEP